MSLNHFIGEYGLGNKATSNIIKNILSSLSVYDVGISSRDGPFSSDVGRVKLHTTKGTHWVAFKNRNYFDSYGCSPPQKLSEFLIKQNGYCLYSEYNIQELHYYCAAYCLFIIYLTKVLAIDFISAILN